MQGSRARDRCRRDDRRDGRGRDRERSATAATTTRRPRSRRADDLGVGRPGHRAWQDRRAPAAPTTPCRGATPPSHPRHAARSRGAPADRRTAEGPRAATLTAHVEQLWAAIVADDPAQGDAVLLPARRLQAGEVDLRSRGRLELAVRRVLQRRHPHVARRLGANAAGAQLVGSRSPTRPSGYNPEPSSTRGATGGSTAPRSATRSTAARGRSRSRR